MKDRLLQLLDLEHLTPSKFADLIGVQRSSVSHILSGRNKPSFDFLQKTLTAFSGLRADWLLLGEGQIYDQMGREPSDLFDRAEKKPDEQIELSETIEQTVEPPSEADEVSEKPVETRKVIQVMLFYDDDTFISYKPSQ